MVKDLFVLFVFLLLFFFLLFCFIIFIRLVGVIVVVVLNAASKHVLFGTNKLTTVSAYRKKVRERYAYIIFVILVILITLRCSLTITWQAITRQ